MYLAGTKENMDQLERDNHEVSLLPSDLNNRPNSAPQKKGTFIDVVFLCLIIW